MLILSMNETRLWLDWGYLDKFILSINECVFNIVIHVYALILIGVICRIFNLIEFRY